VKCDNIFDGVTISKAQPIYSEYKIKHGSRIFIWALKWKNETNIHVVYKSCSV